MSEQVKSNTLGAGANTNWCETHDRGTGYVDHTGRRSCHPDRGGNSGLCHVVPCTRQEAAERRAQRALALRERMLAEPFMGHSLRDAVEAFRLDAGLAICDFSVLLGMSNTSYSNFAMGRNPLGVNARVRMAALGMDPALLLARDEDFDSLTTTAKEAPNRRKQRP